MKTLLITGASSGIGHATALAAAEYGWKVIACGRNLHRLQALADRSANISILVFDLADRSSCKLALKDVNPDVVLLNAGSCEYVDTNDWNVDLFHRVFAANFFSNVNILECLLSALKPGNQIVFVDSLARMLPFTRSQAYGASKAATHYLAKTLDVDLKSRGIVVQTVSPGFVRTPLTNRNEFRMPMRVEVDRAAEEILKAIRKQQKDLYFPWIFAALIRSVAQLPSPVQVRLCQRLANTSGPQQ
ncbi:MAG: SDR family NAD(P)-dependent oxidoreductase [Pseudomonadota bacterium]